MNTLHFVSLNIERDKHLELVIPFLKAENPDIICLQEIFERDVSVVEKELGMTGHFTQMFRWPKFWPEAPDENTEIISMGIAMFTKLPVLESNIFCYAGDNENIPVFTGGDKATSARSLLTLSVNVEGRMYTFGTTHFTWTPHGETDDRQRRDLKKFLAYTEEFAKGIVFAGDFNAPRGGEIFTEISHIYKDNIPTEYETSLDINMHRAPDEVKHLMVDGLFTSLEYEARNVRLQYGVSDHAAIVADIHKI